MPKNNDRARTFTTPPAGGQPEPPEPEGESWVCPNCGEPHEDRSARVATADSVGCDSCTDLCPDCRTHEFTDGFQRVGRYRPGTGQRRMVCGPCVSANYHECPDCERTLPVGEMTGTNASNDTICEGCDESYFTCDTCGGRLHNDDHGDDGNCQECTHAANTSGLIHDYDHKPDPEFHGDGRHYGVELETVLKRGDLREAAGDVLDKLNSGLPEDGFAYLKRDGSLNEGVGGFEIVTHPATLDVHKARWPAVLGSNAPAGLASHDSSCCGLHVHVEREGLTDLAVGKMLSFTNAANNKDFIEAVARRDPSRWAKLDPTKKPQDAVKRNGSRYEAINLQNDGTIEFRIFKGTLKPESFFRSLEFVDALVEFARPAESGLRDMIGPDAFFEFVARYRDRYPNLFPFCEEFAGRELARKPNPKKFAEGVAPPAAGPAGARMSVVLKYRPRRDPQAGPQAPRPTTAAGAPTPVTHPGLGLAAFAADAPPDAPPAPPPDAATLLAAYARLRAEGDGAGCRRLRAMLADGGGPQAAEFADPPAPQAAQPNAPHPGHQAFQSLIAKRPLDRATRGVYADWIEEHDPSSADPEGRVLHFLRSHGGAAWSSLDGGGMVRAGRKWAMPEIKAASEESARRRGIDGWFARGNMRMFGTRLLPKEVRSGPGGTYFVHESDNHNRTGKEYRIEGFNPNTGDTFRPAIYHTPSEDMDQMHLRLNDAHPTVEAARELAQRLARGEFRKNNWAANEVFTEQLPPPPKPFAAGVK